MGEIKEFLKTLNITKAGQESSNNSYVIDIDTYDEYGKFFSILEKAYDAGKIDQLENNSVISTHTTDVSYITPEDSEVTYEISLLGDLDQDIYRLVVTKLN